MQAVARKLPRQFARRRQRGVAALVLVLLLGLALSVSLFGMIRSHASEAREDTAQTERALALAKEALIAYASGRDASNRPGELPCPDTTNDGTAENICSTPASRIGRLPWATLGIPDLRDGSGERLWYAVSDRFKRNPALTPLNSNTPGQLSVTGMAPAANVIAIVFAPGAVVGAQSRVAANVNNVAHYLEGENANGDTVFATAASSATFNDRLLAITPTLFFPAVEIAVARHLRIALNTYYNLNHYYPPANAYGGTCIAANQGLLPADPSTCGGGHAPFGFLPTWFVPNQWQSILLYAVAPACVSRSALYCSGTSGLLTVNGNSAHVVLFSPGAPVTGQPRPCTSHTDCLEAPNTASYPVFTQINNIATNNDRMVMVP